MLAHSQVRATCRSAHTRVRQTAVIGRYTHTMTHIMTHIMRSRRMRRAGVVVLIAAALTLTIFPFDWLAQVWPAYRAVFDRVFVTARDHAAGHATLFCLVGLAVLALAPGLRARVWRYLGLGLLGALAQEAVQALAKQDWPNWGDGRDILFDTLGLLVAFALVQFILWRWKRTQSRHVHTTPPAR